MIKTPLQERDCTQKQFNNMSIGRSYTVLSIVWFNYTKPKLLIHIIMHSLYSFTHTAQPSQISVMGLLKFGLLERSSVSDWHFTISYSKNKWDALISRSVGGSERCQNGHREEAFPFYCHCELCTFRATSVLSGVCQQLPTMLVAGWCCTLCNYSLLSNISLKTKI